MRQLPMNDINDTVFLISNVYFLIEINGEIYTDRDIKTIDESIEWEE